MMIDITALISEDMLKKAEKNLNLVTYGHLGTHFDVMNKKFPLEFIQRNGIVFDISNVKDRDIDIHDIDLNLVKKDMFVAFYSGCIDRIPYGSKEYFKNHPQLSYELIEELLKKQISIIGIDFSGIRNGNEHIPADQKCVDNGAFVIENLCNLHKVLNDKKSAGFIANTYPVNFQGMSGLPCRVVAKI